MATTRSTEPSLDAPGTPAGRDAFDEWIAIDDAAAYLAIPVRTLYRLAQRGQLPATKVGRTWRFKRSLLDRYLAGAPLVHDGGLVDAPASAPRAAATRDDTLTTLLAEARRWSGHLEGIAELARQLNRSRTQQEVGDIVAREIGSLIEYDGLRFYALQPDGETLEAIVLRSHVDEYAAETRDDVRLRLGEGLGGTVARAGMPELVGDVLRDPRMQDIPGSADVDESMLIVPFVYEDEVLGVMELSRLGLHRFEPGDLRLGTIVAAQASVALANARQVEELERRSADLERQLESQRRLLDITERLLLERRPEAIFTAVADTLSGIVPHDTLTIYLVDQQAGLLVPVVARDEYAAEILASRLPIGQGITGDVVARGEAELVNDALHDPRVVHVPGTPLDEQESIIVVPLKGPAGVIGALNLYRLGGAFAPEDLQLAKLYGNHAAIALENAHVHAELLRAAETDPLTGLRHHGAFGAALATAVSAGGDVAVLMIDLDNFKAYNDRHGHPAGDALLRTLAERLADAVRANDVVCRYGGDEFAIVLPATDEAGARVVARKVLATLRSLPGAARAARVGASIGIAVYPVDADNARDLVAIADTALYVAKNEGKARVVSAGQLPAQIGRLGALLDDAVIAARQTRGGVDPIAVVRPLHAILAELEPALGANSERAAGLCLRVAPALGVTPDVARSVAAAALVCDIGRLAADDERKTQTGPIATAHPILAARLLDRHSELRAVADLVRHHHERWDGAGYPDRLVREAMPPGVRLLTAANRWATLTGDATGSRAEPAHRAAAVLRSEGGRLLAPDAVAAILAEVTPAAA